MLLGKINFGPAGKLDYEIPAEAISKVVKHVHDLLAQVDENVILDHLKRYDRSALLRLASLIDLALADRGP